MRPYFEKMKEFGSALPAGKIKSGEVMAKEYLLATAIMTKGKLNLRFHLGMDFRILNLSLDRLWQPKLLNKVQSLRSWSSSVIQVRSRAKKSFNYM